MIFKEFDSEGIIIEPDEAMQEMDNLLDKLLFHDSQQANTEGATRPPVLFRFSSAAYQRDAHHYAVDRYYKTYFPRRRGAEPLPDTYLNEILELRRKGLNYVAIAQKWGVPRDRMRKQVEAAEKRLRELGEELKRRFPQFVAADPRMTNGEYVVPGIQSMDQKKSKKAGK